MSTEMNRHWAQASCKTAAVAAAVFLSLSGWAAEPVLIQGEKSAITASDVRADAMRVPPEMRGAVLSRPENIAQAATNLYVRRAMAEKAQEQGLAEDPVVAAALKIARDKVLSDVFMARLDRDNMPSEAAVEGLARDLYKAKPERFNAPEQVQIRHILIAAKEADAQEKAEKLLKELQAGADFSAMAKERSADPGSAAKGGDLGLFARGSMVPEFDKAAFALEKPGELSGVVKTQFGYHVLQLVARKAPVPRSFEEVRAEVSSEVRAGILQDFRVAEAQKIQQGIKLNQEAVRAVANSFRTGAP
jgi:peptidyl-prolyl cis-trans isomerase C